MVWYPAYTQDWLQDDMRSKNAGMTISKYDAVLVEKCTHTEILLLLSPKRLERKRIPLPQTKPEHVVDV